MFQSVSKNSIGPLSYSRKTCGCSICTPSRLRVNITVLYNKCVWFTVNSSCFIVTFPHACQLIWTKNTEKQSRFPREWIELLRRRMLSWWQGFSTPAQNINTPWWLRHGHSWTTRLHYWQTAFSYVEDNEFVKYSFVTDLKFSK